MIQTRTIGDARVTRVLEYSAPTHPPEFLFPDLTREELDRAAEWLAPNHYVRHMDRLIVTIQLWIVQTGGHTIVVDTGVGNHKPRGAARMNNLNSLVMPWLEAAGAGPADVTHVLHTHLHSDHTGWNTVLSDGRWVPTFPNARYLMPKTEYDYFKAEVEKGVHPLIDNSFADSVDPVVDAGLVDFIGNDQSDVLGIFEIEKAPGHSPGMLSYRIRSGGEEGLFCADVFHSPMQIAKPSLNTAYCVFPDIARETRARTLNKAADRNSLIMPMHFGAPHCGYVRREGDGFRFEPASW